MTTQEPNPPLVFAKVDALRVQLMLTQEQFSTLLGVTRVTYMGWCHDKPIRKKNDARVRAILRKVLKAIKRHPWPSPEVAAMTTEQRYHTLLEIMNETD